MNERIPLAYLLPLRLFCGVILVLEGWSKFKGNWLHGAPILHTLDGWVDANSMYPFFLSVVENARAAEDLRHARDGRRACHRHFDGTRSSDAPGRLPGRGDALLLRVGGRPGPVRPGNSVVLGAIFVLFIVAPPSRVFGCDQALCARLPRRTV